MVLTELSRIRWQILKSPWQNCPCLFLPEPDKYFQWLIALGKDWIFLWVFSKDWSHLFNRGKRGSNKKLIETISIKIDGSKGTTEVLSYTGLWTPVIFPLVFWWFFVLLVRFYLPFSWFVLAYCWLVLTLLLDVQGTFSAVCLQSWSGWWYKPGECICIC